MSFADSYLATLPLDLRARGERLRRALVDGMRPASEEPSGALIGAYPQLAEAFADAQQLGLPLSVLVVRVANFDALGGDASAARKAVSAQLGGAFGSGARVAALSGHEFAVLLLGKDQYPDVVACLEHGLERLAARGHEQDGEPLQCQAGIARCPLDADELDELVSLAGRAAADLASSAAAFQFVDRRHRLHCA